MTGWGKLSLFLLVVLVVGAYSYRKDWKQKYRCRWVRCERNCRKIKDDDGCDKCECGPVCSPPKCDPGCEVQTVFDGPCPGCDCKDVDIGEVPSEKACSPVKCGAPCKEVPGDGPGDCPKCICDEIDDKGIIPGGIACDPPNCAPGCSIQQVFNGPCPGCDCKDEEDEEIGEKDINPGGIVCDPPKCAPGCSIQQIFDGPCPGCDCKEEEDEGDKPGGVVCDPPRCPPGCIIETEYDGPCPGCNCKDKASNYCSKVNTPKLGSIRCSYNSEEKTCQGRCLPGYSFDGYESQDEIILTCREGEWTPFNDFPRCVSSGQCDLVVEGTGSFNCTTGMTGTRCDVYCNKKYSGQYTCYPGKPWDPALPDCVRPKEIVDKPGGIVCDPPKCPPGCSIQKVFDGPCPGCDCDDKKEEVTGDKPGGIVCDPPKCPRGCIIETVYKGPCPGCDCKDKRVEVEEPKIQCDPPKCPEGCTIEIEFDGPCPGCDCSKKEEDEKLCPVISLTCDAGHTCNLEKDENGCDICKCVPKCIPPVCPRRCKLKQGADGCPVCKCHGWMGGKHKRD